MVLDKQKDCNLLNHVGKEEISHVNIGSVVKFIIFFVLNITVNIEICRSYIRCFLPAMLDKIWIMNKNRLTP